MSIIFMYQGHKKPHPIHSSWARSIGARFFHYRVIRYLPVEVLGINRFFRALVRSISRFFYSLYPFRSVNIVITGGSAPLTEALILKSRYNAKIIMIAADPLFGRKLSIAWLRLLREVDGFITVSNMVRSDIINKCRVCRTDHIEIVYPYINVDKFINVKPMLNRYNLVFIGNHHPIKGIMLLPEIFQYVRREIRDVKLYVLGRKTRYTVWLKKYENEDFKIVGYDPNPEKYFMNASVLIHPALYDAFGVVVIEAMASGVIPVITNRTGSKEFVERVSRDLVVEVDPEKIAERVIDVLLMPQDEKAVLSDKLRSLALNPIFTREYSIFSFKKAFYRIVFNK